MKCCFCLCTIIISLYEKKHVYFSYICQPLEIRTNMTFIINDVLKTDGKQSQWTNTK